LGRARGACNMSETYSPSQAVLDFCSTPRTRAEIDAHFADRPDLKPYRYAVYNLVKAGKLVNINADAGTRYGGLYVVTDQAARADVMQEAKLNFSAMAAFWGRQAC
jgi:hypothetical protein